MQGNPANEAHVSYVVMPLTIAANGSDSVNRAANFVTCLSANAPFEVAFDNGPRAHFEAGLTYSPANGFHRVHVYNTTGAALIVQLAFGRGNIRDSRLTLSGSIASRPEVPDTFTSGAPVAAVNGAVTQLAALSVLRSELILVNEGAGLVYIGGDAAALAGEGVPLNIGASLVLTTQAAVYARNDSGAAVNVAVASLEHSP